MTIEEVSKQCQISVEDLRRYEKYGLLECTRTMDGLPDYQTADLRQIGFIRFLTDAGLQIDDLKHFLQIRNQDAGSKEEQIRILKKQRYRLLDDIHRKQQSLDRLDYMIHEIKTT